MGDVLVVEVELIGTITEMSEAHEEFPYISIGEIQFEQELTTYILSVSRIQRRNPEVTFKCDTDDPDMTVV